MELSDPKYYINRELSWLRFNERVLEEAQDKGNLIMERLKFLAITASNMDEFFMVRVPGLMMQLDAKITGLDPAGMTAKEQLKAIREAVHEFTLRQYNCLNRSIFPALEKENLYFLQMHELDKTQEEFIDHYFKNTVYLITTPMAIDNSRPFPLLNNKSLNIIIELKGNFWAVVQIPTVIPRIIELPAAKKGQRFFVFLEDVVKKNIHALFGGYEVIGQSIFRLTRNSDFTIEEDETEDLLYEIERSVKQRKWGEAVRIEIEKTTSANVRAFLEKSFNLHPKDFYEIPGPLDLTVWMGYSSLEGCDNLRNPRLIPQPQVDFWQQDVFGAIRKKDILVHHPYESFECVVNYVKAAAVDPHVLAIKQTLYRVSGDSPIVESLMQAAENGKQVTVMVELKARFDEENNIIWAKKLESAGCHVVYGLVGLKTHAKICLVVRREDDGIRRYVHLGTGNYNDTTAKIYTDMGLFTCKEHFGRDVSTLFNVLTGYSTYTDWNKLAVAPLTLYETFIKHIEREMTNATEGKEAVIMAKMNSLSEVNVIQALYRASAAGVKIKLIVRGICCLRPGVKGVSDNITVVSIVGRFLEHTRAFYFENGGAPRIFLSSADWMPRNLFRRMEVAFPVEDAVLKEELIEMFRLSLSDTVKVRTLRPDGTYERIDRRGKEAIHSQLIFYQRAVERFNTIKQEENSQFEKSIVLNQE